MEKPAVTYLQQQIEILRRDAFAAGYATAMKAVRELATRAAPMTDDVIAPGGRTRNEARGRTGTRRAAPKLAPAALRRTSRTTGLGAGARRLAVPRAQRGTNARLISDVLRAAAPRALRPAEIRKSLMETGVVISFPSIGYTLRQLGARNAAKQTRDSKTWRHHEGS